MTKIDIDAGTHQWTAQISDSPSARDFLAQLPIDLTLTEIGYYAPWGNIALYHKDGPRSPGLVVIGRIDEPYADLASPGDVQVTIRQHDAAPEHN